MKTATIKKHILELPDKEIKPLFDWLHNYYDGPVWDRQMDADIGRLGADEWERRLSAGMEEESKESGAVPLLTEEAHNVKVRQAWERIEKARRRREAALRLLNRLPFPTKAARTRMLKDLECALGEPLGAASEREAPLKAKKR